MQFANFSQNIYCKKIAEFYVENMSEKTLWKIFRGEYCAENFAEFCQAENCFSLDYFLKYNQLNRLLTTVFAYCWACACYLRLRGE